MSVFVNFGTEFAASLIVFSLLAKWYVWPYLRKLSFRDALLILLLPFLLRFLGLASLVPGVVDPILAQSTFAFYQAYGDFIAFLLAFSTFILVYKGYRYALVSAWVFNIFGIIDHLNSLFLGITSQSGGGLDAFWYIPVVIVPLDLVVHTLIFILLIKRGLEWSNSS